MDRSHLFDSTYRLLGKSIDVSTRRHSLIAGNVANLDTVGYKPKDIDFRKTLEVEMQKGQEKLARTNEKHFSAASSNNGISLSSDGFDNDDPVNIDTEMSKLVENNIKYMTSVEMLKKKMRILKHAISEGGR